MTTAIHCTRCGALVLEGATHTCGISMVSHAIPAPDKVQEMIADMVVEFEMVTRAAVLMPPSQGIAVMQERLDALIARVAVIRQVAKNMVKDP